MDASRRSPVLAAYPGTAFEIGSVNDMQIALRAHKRVEPSNYSADLSALRRRLFVGSSAAAWLKDRGVETPLELLRYRVLESSAVIVRLHWHQFLLIDGLDGPSPYEDLFALPAGRHDEVLALAYEAAEFAVGGPQVNAVLDELCPMNLSAIDHDVWIATRAAHCELALRRIDDGLAYRLVCSPADAAFLFGVLSDVTRERGGAIIGFEDYRALANYQEREK